jgi:Na+-transporting methylmalonyl-CoA/oxaloacetate decarboxylase gamma subunit
VFSTAVFFLCLALLAVLIWLLSLVSVVVSEDNSKDDPNGSSKERNAAAEFPDDSQDQHGAAAIANAIHAYRRSRDAQEGLRAKREKATIVALFAAASFAFLAAIAAIASAVIFNGQLSAMHEEQRAWVSIDAPPRLSAPLTYDVNNGAQFRLLFTFNNYGHSPAQNVSTFFEVFPGLGCHTDAECLVIQKRVCGVAVGGVTSTSLIVFPGEHPQSQELQYISNADLAAATVKMPATFKVIFPRIFLCIAYRITEDEEIKKTWYAFDVIRSQQNGVIRITDGEIPAEELIVRLNPLAPMGAD